MIESSSENSWVGRRLYVRPPEDPSKYVEMLSKAYNDPLYFCRTFLGYSTPKHYEKWVEDVNSSNRLVILAHRDSGKSVFFSFVYPLWTIFRGDVTEILLIGAEANEASRRLEELRAEIENNLWLQHLANRGARTWGKNRFITKPPYEGAIKGVEVSAMGYKSAKRGRHPQLLLLDDILNEKTNLSMYDVKYIFKHVIMNMLSSGSRFVMVGTPFSYDDIYTDLSENPRFLVKKYPALDNKNKPLWKEKWSYEDLMIRKQEIGEAAFSTEYMLKPVTSQIGVFKEHYINGARRKTFKLGDIPNPRGIVVAGVDFAFSESKRADYTVITVVSKINSTYRIIDVWREQGASMTQISEVMSLLHDMYNIEVFIAENTGQQQGIIRELTTKGHYIKPINVNRYNKNTILGKLVFEFEKRRIAIPANEDDFKTKEYFNTLKTELLGYVNQEGKYLSLGKHDDTVMSLSFAIDYLSDLPDTFEEQDFKIESIPFSKYNKSFEKYTDNIDKLYEEEGIGVAGFDEW